MIIKLKFIFCFFFLLFLTPKICFAKIIEIDRITYDVVDVLDQETFIYDAKNDTLTLKNANLKTIKTSNSLKINVEGENTLVNDISNLDSIVAKDLIITGSGNLNIISNRKGIIGERIKIQGTNLSILSKSDAITSSSSYNYDIIIDDSNLNIGSEVNIFNVVSGNLYLNNSNIKILKGKYFVGGFTNDVYLNNTNLEIEEINSFRISSKKVYVNQNSKLYIHAIDNRFLNKNYIINDNLTMLTSLDGNIYSELKNEKDNYIKIYPTVTESSLQIQKEKLTELEKKLQEQSIYLQEEEKKLNSLKDALSLKEANLVNFEKSLNEKKEEMLSFENILVEKENSLLEFSNSLKEQEELIQFKQIELETLQKELTSKKEILSVEEQEYDKKQEELAKTKALLGNEKSKIYQEESILLKEKMEVEKMKKELEKREILIKNESAENSLEEFQEVRVEDYEEVLVDDEIYLEDDSKFINFIKNNKIKFSLIAIFILFLSIIITILKRRRVILNG